MIPQVGAIQQAVAEKRAKPVGPEARAQLGQNYAKVWQDLGAVDGTQYGVYFKAANKSVIWYNAAAFDNAGAAEPKTWKDFITTAETISASGVTPVSVAGADGWTLTDWFENVYLSRPAPEVRPAGEARDPVDRPVGRGRATPWPSCSASRS
ncbi:hypothetical protein SMICM304S_01180 [Streptomyces microflavus]